MSQADSLYRPQNTFTQAQFSTCRIGHRCQRERRYHRQVFGILQQFFNILFGELGNVTKPFRTLGRIFSQTIPHPDGYNPMMPHHKTQEQDKRSLQAPHSHIYIFYRKYSFYCTVFKVNKSYALHTRGSNSWHVRFSRF